MSLITVSNCQIWYLLTSYNLIFSHFIGILLVYFSQILLIPRWGNAATDVQPKLLWMEFAFTNSITLSSYPTNIILSLYLKFLKINLYSCAILSFCELIIWSQWIYGCLNVKASGVEVLKLTYGYCCIELSSLSVACFANFQ